MSIATDIFGGLDPEYVRKLLDLKNPFISVGLLPDLQDDLDLLIAHSDIILADQRPEYLNADAWAIRWTPAFRANLHSKKVAESMIEEANIVARNAAQGDVVKGRHQDVLDTLSLVITPTTTTTSPVLPNPN